MFLMTLIEDHYKIQVLLYKKQNKHQKEAKFN